MIKELDNDECRAAAQLAMASAPSLYSVPDPISMGALLWHDLVEIRGGEFVHITDKGRAWLKNKGEEK